MQKISHKFVPSFSWRLLAEKRNPGEIYVENSVESVENPKTCSTVLDKIEHLLYSCYTNMCLIFEPGRTKSPNYGTEKSVCSRQQAGFRPIRPPGISLEGETMQTLYYTTGNFIRHTGNVVDLTEYRRRLAQAQQEPEEGEENLVLLPRESAPSPRRTRARRARRRALFLDACASMGVVVMTLTFTLRVLAL